MNRKFFGTGLARSGGGLYSVCLSNHKDMMVACCPNLELFRSYRNALVKNSNDSILIESIKSNLPLQDYHGTEVRLKLLDLFLNAEMDIPFDSSEWESFLSISKIRGELESADLSKHYDSLKGNTYKDIFDNLLHIIGSKRNSENKKYIGFHEAWAIDTYPALARSYPDAKFLIMFRDIRATINSVLGVTRIDPSQVVQALSYIRHWRKYVALANKFSNMPLFKDRLIILSHDYFLFKPKETLEKLFNFLELEMDEKLLDTNNYFDYATGKIWGGNSSFEENTSGLSSHRSIRWKTQLDSSVIEMIEYLCGHDLEFVGYPLMSVKSAGELKLKSSIVNQFLKDVNSYTNWRSDLNDPFSDLSLEISRHELLTLDDGNIEASIIRKMFLFEDYYSDLKNQNKVMIPNLANVLAGA